MKQLTTAIILSAFLLPALLLLGLQTPAAWAAETPNGATGQAVKLTTQSPIAKMVEEAKTPADHLRIAEWYEAQAKEARAEARKFGALSDCYTNKVRAGSPSLRAHRWCSLQARRYRSAAQEDEQLAKMHRKIAEQLAKTSNQ